MALSAPAVAQENDGGLLTTLRLSETLRDEDGGLVLRSAADLTFSSVTRRDRFELDLGGVYNLYLDGEDSSNFNEPNINMLYQRDGFASAVELSLGFRRLDIEEATFIEDDDQIGVLTEDGERETRSASFSFDWGEDAPFGGRLTASYLGTRFLDVPSADLTDSDVYRASLRLNFDVDRRITLFTEASYSATDREDGVDVESTTLSLGAGLAISQTLDGSFDLGYTRVVEEGAGADVDQKGVTANASLTQTLPSGNLTGSLSTQLGESGRTTTLNVRRLIDLRDGELSFGLGYGEVDGTGRGLFSLGYVREGRRDTIRARFDQTFSGSNAGDAVLNSAMSLSYAHQVNQSARVNVGANFRETNPLDASLDTSRQWSVQFDYSHDLNETWSLTSGVSHTRRESSDGTTTKDDAIFVGLSTVLSWRR